MGIIKDILAALKQNEIHLVNHYQEAEDIYTFVFKREPSVTWEAGQHGIITIQHVKIKKSTRAFSLSSIPSEGVIKISTGMGDQPSLFKQALLSLKPGEAVSMRGPVGGLYTPNDQPQLFIAGGIGITPFRAIIQDKIIKAEGTAKDIQLIYLDSRGVFIYKSEFESPEQAAIMKTSYLTNREELLPNIEKFVKNIIMKGCIISLVLGRWLNPLNSS